MYSQGDRSFNNEYYIKISIESDRFDEIDDLKDIAINNAIVQKGIRKKVEKLNYRQIIIFDDDRFVKEKEKKLINKKDHLGFFVEKDSLIKFISPR